MGLDNYAMRSPDGDLTDEDEQAFEDAGINLAEGPSGFRGKLYDELITNVTGMSLYEKWLAPDVVQKMWIALERCDPEKAVRSLTTYKHDPDVVLELRKFFRVCVERKLGIISSW